MGTHQQHIGYNRCPILKTCTGPSRDSKKRKLLHLITWNVHNQKPPADLNNLFEVNPSPEIYGIGLQEASSYDWVDAISAVLFPNDYVMVKTRRVQGIVTAMYVKRSMLPFVTSIESEVTKTGLGGYWGNKGGVSLRMDFMGLNFIIVNCHLAAHHGEVQARLCNIDAILDNQKFKDNDTDNILDHDYIFWMGDMNFRIDERRERVLSDISQKRYSNLLSNDQLNIVKKEGLAFENFKEAQIDFAPTYKFDPNTDTYDTSEKQRIPAYCDRIIHHTHDCSYGSCKLGITCISYRSHPEYKCSDHKPVSGVFQINVMSKPISQPVKFEVSGLKWNKSHGITLKYHVKRDFRENIGDWIGVYKANFTTFSQYLAYVWAPTKSDIISQLNSKGSNKQVKFLKSHVEIATPGQYVFCYMTYKYSLCGISDTFSIS